MSNSCGSLPTGTCPDSRCDKTLKSTIHDLFLCQSCEKTRDAESKEIRDAEAKTAELKDVSTKKPTKQLTKKKPLVAKDAMLVLLASIK